MKINVTDKMKSISPPIAAFEIYELYRNSIRKILNRGCKMLQGFAVTPPMWYTNQKIFLPAVMIPKAKEN